MEESGLQPGMPLSRAEALGAAGHTVSWLGETAPASRLLGFVDAVKPSAKGALEALRRQGIRTMMLTSEGSGAAQAVVAALGMDNVKAEMLPEGKEAAVATLREEGCQAARVADSERVAAEAGGNPAYGWRAGALGRALPGG